MSGAAIKVAERQVLPHAHALALRTIASSINHRLGFGWKSQQQMAALSNGISWATFKRCLSDLKALGLVTVERKMVRGRPLTVYRMGPVGLVRWRRKEDGTWREFLEKKSAEIASNNRRPSESKQEHAHRIMVRAGYK